MEDNLLKQTEPVKDRSDSLSGFLRSEFIRKEAQVRAKADYGLFPYEPSRPCKILGTSIHYTCQCGHQTTSSRDIFDHCAGKVCLAGEVL